MRTILIKAPTLDTLARSALLDMIESEAAGGPAHGRDLCVASLTRRAWNGDESGVHGLLTRDTLGIDGLDTMPELTESDIDAAVSGWGVWWG